MAGAVNLSECDNLDGYLAGWLSADDRARFTAHLPECPVCRNQAERQKVVDRLLAQGDAPLEPAPNGLIDRIEEQIRRSSRRRRVRLVGGLSAAAAVMGCAVWLGIGSPGSQSPPVAEQIAEPSPRPEPAEPPNEKAAAPEEFVQVTFDPPSDYIAIPIESAKPGISIIWVYPTVKPSADHQAPADESATSTQGSET